MMGELLPDSSDEAKRRQEDLELRAKEMAHGIINILKTDLKTKGQNEAVANVPLVYQQYSTDCGIACGRIILAHLGESDPGTDGWVSEAKKKNLDVPEMVGADGKPGPVEDPLTTQSILDEHGIDQRTSYGDMKKHQQDFTAALIEGRPVRLGIRYHDLHPEDQSEMERYHGVVAKGYRLKENDELVVVVNDPKQEVGGEIEMNEETLSKALIYPFRTYSKVEAK